MLKNKEHSSCQILKGTVTIYFLKNWVLPPKLAGISLKQNCNLVRLET